jgi:hypothetical protein
MRTLFFCCHFLVLSSTSGHPASEQNESSPVSPVFDAFPLSVQEWGFEAGPKKGGPTIVNEKRAAGAALFSYAMRSLAYRLGGGGFDVVVVV